MANDIARGVYDALMELWTLRREAFFETDNAKDEQDSAQAIVIFREKVIPALVRLVQALGADAYSVSLTAQLATRVRRMLYDTDTDMQQIGKELMQSLRRDLSGSRM